MTSRSSYVRGQMAKRTGSMRRSKINQLNWSMQLVSRSTTSGWWWERWASTSTTRTAGTTNKINNNNKKTRASDTQMIRDNSKTETCVLKLRKFLEQMRLKDSVVLLEEYLTREWVTTSWCWLCNNNNTRGIHVVPPNGGSHSIYNVSTHTHMQISEPRF